LWEIREAQGFTLAAPVVHTVTNNTQVPLMALKRKLGYTQ
jgi:hypothetical protein